MELRRGEVAMSRIRALSCALAAACVSVWACSPPERSLGAAGSAGEASGGTGGGETGGGAGSVSAGGSSGKAGGGTGGIGGARPYFMVVIDVSGSMNECTTPPTTFPATCPEVSATSPNNACGLRPTRINDGKCALRKLVESFSEVDFGLTTFAQAITDCSAICTPYSIDGFMPENAGTCSVSGGCKAGSGMDATGGLIRVPLPITEDTRGNMLKWLDDDCTGGEEVLPAGATPINGAFRDAVRHLRANASALAPNSRSVGVILVTGGGESCDATEVENRAKFSAQDLYLSGLQDGSGRSVKTYPIAVGGATTAVQTALNGIAKMGQCGTETGTCADSANGLSADNEAQLTQSLASIIASAGKPGE